MKRRLVLLPIAIAAVLIDSFLFPALPTQGIRPLFTLAVALAAVASTKVQDGMLIAFFGGLFTDLFCNPYTGLSAAAYLLAVCVLYGFVRKNRPKLGLLLIFAGIACAAAEALIVVFSLILGARTAMLHRLLVCTLPSIILEALLVLPPAAALQSAGKGTFERR